MRKLALIVLLVCFVVSIGVVALAEVKFGNWDKWDEQLPPADHEDWNWALKTKEPRTMTLKNCGDNGKDVVLWFSDLYFGPKKGSKRASAIFYTQGSENKKDWDISKADLALVAFPHDKKKETIIRAYRITGEKSFFLEEWRIPFKNNQIVVSEDTNFKEIFKEWIEEPIAPGIPITEDLIDFMLPELIIWEKNLFMIIDRQKPSK